MSKVLCIDLDGTLLNTDSLHEAVFSYIKSNPFRILLLMFWLLRGRAHLKQKLAQRSSLDVSTLPYNDELLKWLTQLKEQGRKIVLVTAADQTIAEQIAPHVGFFDDVLASNGKINLSARNKADALNRRYGNKQYDYAGNSHADMHVWRDAHEAIVVNASNKLIQRTKKVATVSKTFPRHKLTFRAFLKAIRVHQYAKNILIFLPLLAGHLINKFDALLTTTIGFVCFCLMASSVYLLNDLLDLNSDRKHPTKSQRAIASGLLSIPKASMLLIAFFILAFSLSSYLSHEFKVVLLAYYAITLCYSFQLKQVVLLDVIVLSLLYTIRIVAGMSLMIVGNDYSLWMLLFSMFFFLSLAFLKRVSELYLLEKNGFKQLLGRNYYTADTLTFSIFGIVSGFMAILVFALYLNSPTALLLYRHAQWLILIFPFMIYWLCRMWLLATQGKVNEDPVIYTIRDRISYYIGFCILTILYLAS